MARHIVPLAARKARKYDKFTEMVVTPEVVAVLHTWDLTLKGLFRVYCKLDEAMGYGPWGLVF